MGEKDMIAVRFLKVRGDSTQQIGIVAIIEGRLLASGTEWVRGLLSHSAGVCGEEVEPDATEEFLRALWYEYSGTRLIAEWEDALSPEEADEVLAESKREIPPPKPTKRKR